MSVMLLKLVTGDEIVADVLKVGETFVEVSEPLRVVEFLGVDGSRASYLTRWLPHSSAETMKVFQSMLVTPPLRVSLETAHHWKVAVEYAKRVSDSEFANGLVRATRSMELLPEPVLEVAEKEVTPVKDSGLPESPSDEFKERVILSTLAKLPTTIN